MPLADPFAAASANPLMVSMTLPSEPPYLGTKVQAAPHPNGALPDAAIQNAGIQDVAIQGARDAATPSLVRVVTVHEWIPMGSLATRTQCRCCHCGVTRSYELTSEPSVSYARYGQTFVAGPMDDTEAPACVPQGRRMPPVIAARSWDILSWAQP